MGIKFNARTNSIETDATSIAFTQPITTPASTTSLAGLNIAEAVAAPSAPVDGDVWVTAAGAFNARLNGVTVDLAAGGGGGTIGGSITDNQIAVGATTADDIEGQSNLTYVSGTILTQINTGGTARDVRHFSDSTDAVDLVLRYDGSNFEYRSETGAAGNMYMQFTQSTGGVDFGGAITASNLSGTNTGDEPAASDTVAGIVELATIAETNTGTDATRAVTPDGLDGWTGSAQFTTAGALTATSYDGVLAANLVDKTATEVISGSWNFSTATDTVPFYVSRLGTASESLQFGVDDNNATITLNQDETDATAHGMVFNIASTSTGEHGYYFDDNGGNQVTFDMTNNTYTFNGALEMIAQSDHGPSFFSGGCMVWARSESLGDELYYTAGDNSGIDHTLQNVMEAGYQFSSTTTAADPGAGILRYNNATPASVTNLYIDDLESTGKDASYLLSNLADGDIIKIKDVNNAAHYLVASVNGTPTDNTGWWTVPVTVIHSGTTPTNGGPIQVDVEWSGSQGGGTIAGSITDNQVAVGATTANSIEGSAGFTFDAASNTLSIYDTTDAERLQISNSLTQAVLNTNAGSSFAFQQGGTNILTLASGTSTFTSGVTLSGAADDLNMPTDGNIIWPLGEIYATSNDFIIGARGSSTGNDFFIQTNRGGTAKDGIIIRNNFAVEVYYNDVLKFQTSDETAADNSSGAEVVDGSGTLRSVGFNLTPHVTNNATNVPFTQAQVGYDIISTNATAYTWTTNASTGLAQTDIPLGSMWKCTNLGAGNITIAGGSGVTLTWFDGSGTTGNRTLGQYGTCTVYKYSNTAYHIWGTGLT